MPSKCSSVDLPAPEGPMMETNSPSLISALMRRNTNVLVGPCSKYFSTFRSVRIGELIVYVSIVTHRRGASLRLAGGRKPEACGAGAIHSARPPWGQPMSRGELEYMSRLERQELAARKLRRM